MFYFVNLLYVLYYSGSILSLSKATRICVKKTNKNNNFIQPVISFSVKIEPL